MNTQRPTRDSMSIEEALISSKWGSNAIVEALERTGSVIERGAAGGEGSDALTRNFL